MGTTEIEEYLQRIDEGLKESSKELLHDYALHDDSLVVGDMEGNVLHVPAKKILSQHPELAMEN